LSRLGDCLRPAGSLWGLHISSIHQQTQFTECERLGVQHETTANDGGAIIGSVMQTMENINLSSRRICCTWFAGRGDIVQR
jgi:hypothetical protein